MIAVNTRPVKKPILAKGSQVGTAPENSAQKISGSALCQGDEDPGEESQFTVCLWSRVSINGHSVSLFVV